MKKIFLTLLILLSFVFTIQAQYSDTRVLEKQFENSDLYFKRFYLNTFGLKHFSDVSSGFFSDPFSRVKLNPTFGLTDTSRHCHFYFDYRSDRMEEIPRSFIRPMVYAPGTDIIAPNPRWYRISRTEPQPVFSAGFRSRIASRFHFTAVYQFIYKEEPYYRQPYYWDRLETYYNGFKAEETPVVSYQRKQNQTLTRAHLLATYLAYRIRPNLWAGVGANFVSHKRNADYLYLNNDRFDQTNYASNADNRNLSYWHNDFSLGLNWLASQAWQFGIQVGRLKGRARQSEAYLDSMYVSFGNGHSYYHRETVSHFDHSGNRYYTTLTFQFSPNPHQRLFAFLNYARLQNDLRNRSDVDNRDLWIYQFRNGLEYERSSSVSTLTSRRTDNGTLNEHLLESMISLRITQNKRNIMRVGFYYSYLNGKKHVTEPAPVDVNYQYHVEENDQAQGPYSYDNTYLYQEDKTLYWTYRYTRYSLQMPIYGWHKVNRNLAFFVIINKVWTAWKTSEKIDAYYKDWYKLTDNQETHKQNFIKRYELQPGQNETKDSSDLALGFEVRPIKNVLVRYLINPDWDDSSHISQWWLSIYLNL